MKNLDIDEMTLPGTGSESESEDPSGDQDTAGGLPLISVILPFYNAEKNLGEAVGSIIKQDYQNLEILLVDDASADSSSMQAEEFRRKDSRIKIFRHGENQGAGPARNTGVNNAGGEYIFFLDSDDILRQGALTLLQQTAAREQVEIVIGSCEQVDEDGIISDHDRSRNYDCEGCFGLIEGEEVVERWLNIKKGSFLPVRPWGILIETGLYRRSGLTFSTGEHEDLSFTPFLYKFAGEIFYLKDLIITYRIRAGSIINSPYSVGRVQRYYKVWDDTLQRLGLFGMKNYERDFKIFHIGNLLWHLRLYSHDRDVLEATAELLQSKLNLKGEKSRDKYGRDLAYMPEMVYQILRNSGLESDFQLWTKLVSGFGDGVVRSFIKRKTVKIRNKIWGVQMSNDTGRDELLQLRGKLSEAGIMNEQQDHEISGLKAENERLRKRLMEVSFYLNTLLTDIDRRTAVSNDNILRTRRFGINNFRPATFFRLVKRLPGIRNFREVGIINAIKDSGQFSQEFYRETYSDLGDHQGDLLQHFVRHGGYEGRSPNRYFDSKWYFNANPGVERKGINPLYHYLKIGMKEGLWPSPDYSPAEYGELIRQEGDTRLTIDD